MTRTRAIVCRTRPSHAKSPDEAARPARWRFRSTHWIALEGRHHGNCRKVAEAMTLTQKGNSVKGALCQRRCPFVDRCTYLRQFGQEGDFFAAIAATIALRASFANSRARSGPRPGA